MKVEENSLNVAIDLRQPPAAFPEPTTYTWYKNGQPLSHFHQTFSSVTVPSVQRSDVGNYSVFVANFVFASSMQQVGNDTGSFYLDVICESNCYCVSHPSLKLEIHGTIGTDENVDSYNEFL